MKILFPPTRDPYGNLAMEEYLLHSTTDDWFVLWINDPCIVVGRNQNAWAEINVDHVRRHGIPVVRRLTGGGAVFHDPGNLNYTFIEQGGVEHLHQYARFCQPILNVLHRWGVEASLSGRNDLVVGERKFSGSAQCAWHDRLMHHGCILFDADVGNLTDALRVNPLKIQSKGIQSVRSRVTNLREYLPAAVTLADFCAAVLDEVTVAFPDAERVDLTAQDTAAIAALRDEKYATAAWNFGFKKAYSFHKDSRFDVCLLDVRMNIADDRIADIRLFGDYFGRLDIAGAEEALRGTPYRPDAVAAVLRGLPLEQYIAGLTWEDWLGALF